MIDEAEGEALSEIMGNISYGTLTKCCDINDKEVDSDNPEAIKRVIVRIDAKNPPSLEEVRKKAEEVRKKKKAQEEADKAEKRAVLTIAISQTLDLSIKAVLQARLANL